jgi:hypothetical protein
MEETRKPAGGFASFLYHQHFEACFDQIRIDFAHWKQGLSAKKDDDEIPRL